MKSTYLLLCGLLLQVPVALAATAADAADAPSRRTARSHFLRGVELYRSGAYDAALAEFSRAYESAPNYRILYNLAQIQAQRHDYVEALKLFRRYLVAGGTEISEGRADDVTREIAELERRITRLTVETNVDGARLLLNGTLAAELPESEPLLINAGIHRLRVEKPGHLPAWRVVTLTGGDELTVKLELTPEIEVSDVSEVYPAPPLLVPTPAPVAPERTALWTSLAATGALTGASLTFGVLTRQANNKLDRQLGTYPAPRDAVERTRDQVRTFATLTDVFGVAAAAALGLSAYFYLSPDAGGDEAERPASGLKAQVGGTGGSLSWQGKF
jgi:hypothetical protein